MWTTGRAGNAGRGEGGNAKEQIPAQERGRGWSQSTAQGVGCCQSRRGTALPWNSLGSRLEGSRDRWGQIDGRIEGFKALCVSVKCKASYSWDVARVECGHSRGGAAPGGGGPRCRHR